jgi:pimeloyl-ACP methyl ester carboxylesterase
LIPLRHWLERIGYHAFYSGIRFNADCPNLLIQRQLNEAIDTALEKTGGKVHLIGHSLGGIMAHAVAGQRSRDVASVVTLGAPLKGMVAHTTVLRAAEQIRLRIIREHGTGVMPNCYTARCTCDFANSVRRCLPSPVMQTAIFTEDDGLLDWRYCKTNQASADFAVSGTHIGLVFNPSVYTIIADRLKQADSGRH